MPRANELPDHISTTATVRDLELLRQLVGDPALQYFGASYGTQIGALYAELYPDTVGRMVLDAAVDISDSDISQLEGFGNSGFPEAHAASFAILVYVSSWLKCVHPDVFVHPPAAF